MINDGTEKSVASVRPATTQQSADGDRGLFFNTATLSRFMQACYGTDAAREAQRHVYEYSQAEDRDLVEIWKRVVAHLHGIEIKEDHRRIVRVAKFLKVRG